MNKNKVLLLLAIIVMASAVVFGVYIYFNKSYACDSTVEAKTFSSLSLKEEISVYKLSFGFKWNGLTQKMQLSKIDELSTVSFDLDVHYAAVSDSREHNSFVTDNSMGLYFNSGFRPPKSKIENGMPFGENSQITFDKASNFIVINKSQSMKFEKSYLESNVKVAGKCVRQWGI
jgi:hypothetical protein